MALFGKKIKSIEVKPQAEAKASCCCCGGNSCAESASGRFIVLGACCDKSRKTYENVKQAVKELGFTEEVVNIGDAMEIAKFGVMQTPALVVDGKVVAYGRLLTVEKVKEIFAALEVK